MASAKETLEKGWARVRTRVAQAKRTAQGVLEQTRTTALEAQPKYREELETLTEEPPVVARLMVEIRSDGTRTIARGALEDTVSGEQVSLEAKGSTPVQLAAQLAKSLLTTPLAAGQLARAMIEARRGKPRE